MFAENGVSDIADENIVDGNHATVTVTTDQTSKFFVSSCLFH